MDTFIFLFYINDLSNASSFETVLFADNANLYLSCNIINSQQSPVQQEMIKVSNRMISNNLTVIRCYAGKQKTGQKKNLLMIQILVF